MPWSANRGSNSCSFVDLTCRPRLRTAFRAPDPIFFDALRLGLITAPIALLQVQHTQALETLVGSAVDRREPIRLLLLRCHQSCFHDKQQHFGSVPANFSEYRSALWPKPRNNTERAALMAQASPMSA